MIKIDKSRFTAEQRAQYEALLAVAKVDTNAEPGNTPPAAPSAPTSTPAPAAGVQKSATEIALESTRAEVAELKKSLEMKELSDVAKKYTILGKKEDELANTLYEMKKSDENSYKAYIALLDEQKDLVEKSGLFTEIGKSAGAYTGMSDAAAKIEAKAQEIMKADPSIDATTAIAKAWEDNPDLMDEYESEYNG